MIEVKRLQNVYLVAGDVAGTRAFYERVLGLRPKFSDAERWIQYDAHGSGFAVGALAEGVAGQAGAVPVFEVQDFADAERLVGEAGGSVEGIRHMGTHGRVLTLRDPAGNAVQLFCRASGG